MWQGVIGHDAVAEHFRQILAEGRLASTYLFLGPAGIGKRLFAMRLAQALLCQASEPERLDPCGKCESCLLLRAGNHPDVDLLGLPEGKTRLPVELFLGDREHRNQEGLCHNLSLRPQTGSRRVAIIDDADHFSIESANCLLKTLEEPPPGALLILIGTSRGRQLPTILSRSQVVRFSPLDEASLSQLLQAQGIAASADQLPLLVSSAAGSLSRAAELADEELWQLRQQLLPELVPSRFQSVALAKQLADFVSAAGKDAEPRRQRLRFLLRLFIEHFHNLLRACCSPQSATPELPREWLALGEHAQDCCLAVLDRTLEAENQLDRNANQATLIECWLDDLATLLSQYNAVSA